MPWCPICKTEYREGITVCADCKVELVDSLDEIKDFTPLAYLEKEELAEKLVKYLDYSGIASEYAYDDEKEAFAVVVEEKDLKKAKEAYQGFYQVESASELKEKYDEALQNAEDEALEAEEELTEEELREKALEDIVYTSAGVYVKKSDQSKEMMSTAITFVVFGILLLAFMILNALKVITLFSNIPALIILGALAVGCLIVGVNAVGRSKKAGEQSIEEDKATAAINDWMEKNISIQFVVESDDPSLSPELNYLRRVDAIKKALTQKFGELEDTYVDSLIEDFYNSHFE